MKIAIGNDHSGVEMKNAIKKWLMNNKYDVIDLGANDPMVSVNYPDFGFAVGNKVSKQEADYGIVICGTGIGISIAANKVQGVRCALCLEERSALLARQHNDANMLALGARMIANQKALWITETFLTTNFLGERHKTRVELLNNYRNSNQ